MYQQAKYWSPSEVDTLITAYKSYPLLWDSTHKLHNVRSKTRLAHIEIAKMFDTTAAEIARKLHNLKGQFHQEIAKIKKRRESSINETYTSTWRYFNVLSFLLKEKDIEANTNYTSDDTSHVAETPETKSLSLIEGKQEESETFKLRRKLKKRKVDTSLISKCSQIVNEPNDDNQIFADYVASELRKLSKEGNKKLRRIIQRAIINIQDEEDGVQLKCSPKSVTSNEDSSSSTNYNY